MPADTGSIMAAAGGDGVRLSHLGGAASPVRQVIAAYAVEGIDHVIEIGGAGLPITRFLRHAPHSVTVIDPKIEPFIADQLHGQPCQVRHLACKIQQANLPPMTGTTAVVLLGMSLKPWGDQASMPDGLIELCDAATVIVIEHAVTLDRAVRQFPELVRRARLSKLWSLDVLLDDPAITGTGHEKRHLVVFRPERLG